MYWIQLLTRSKLIFLNFAGYCDIVFLVLFEPSYRPSLIFVPKSTRLKQDPLHCVVVLFAAVLEPDKFFWRARILFHLGHRRVAAKTTRRLQRARIR